MKTGPIDFEDITLETLPFVQKLLFERNGTLHAYTEWKYGEQGPNGFHGIVALNGKEPVGCFGLMPKVLCSGETQILCGWFADWYITPSMRGSGLGTRLLKEITQKGYSLFFGHPGPRRASKICLQNGWHAIPFQSSRRFIVSPFSYYRRRTHYFVKQAFLVFQYYLEIRKSRKSYSALQTSFVQYNRVYFADQNLDWLRLQPVNPKVKRTYGDWSGKKVFIHYCDDILPSGEVRRRILLIENIQQYPQDIVSFFVETKKHAVDYMEIFTTDKFTDAVLENAGAVRFPESPIVWYGNDDKAQDASIQGLDRENWLYLAGHIS